MEKMVSIYGVEITKRIFDDNGKKYYIADCGRCTGDKFLSGFRHVENGVCFRCRGNGLERKPSRAYTLDEFAKKEAARERREARKIEKAKSEAVEAKKIARANVTFTKASWEIVDDYLKNWTGKTEAPYGVGIVFDMAERVNNGGRLSVRAVSFLETLVTDTVLEFLNKAEANATKVHVGTIGVREEFAVTIKFRKHLDCMYNGSKEMVKLEDADGNEFIYFGKALEEVEKDKPVVLKATVKKHDEFRGTKHTVINRPKVA